MNWHMIIGIIAGFVQVSSIIPYVKSMLKGTTRPNIVSWSTWTLLKFIAISAQFSAGASYTVLLLFATAFNTSLVVILCLMGYGYKKYGTTDKICTAGIIITIAIWLLTKNPILALIMSIVIDIIAAIPTIVKIHYEPYSENVLSWSMLIVADILSVFSTTKLDLANLIYPFYLAILNGIIVGLALWGQKSKQPVLK